MSTSRTLGLATIVLAACSAVSIPAAEAAFRLLGTRPADPTVAVFRPFGRQSYRNAPGADTVEDWASGPFRIRTDSFGLRCGADGTPAADRERALDLLVIGDSQAFGLGVDYEKSVVGTMHELARAQGRSIGNAAIGGHFLRNQIELAQSLHDEGLRFRRVAYLMSSGRVQDPEGYATAHVDPSGALYLAPPDARARVRTWLRTNLAMYKIVRAAWHNQFASRERDPDLPLAVYAREKIPGYTANWRAEMVRFRDWAASCGAEAVLVYLPETFDLDVESVVRARGEADGRYDGRAPFEVCRVACAEAGVPLVDASPALVSRKAAGLRLDLVTDYHYDADTSRAVGEIVWAELSRLGEPK